MQKNMNADRRTMSMLDQLSERAQETFKAQVKPLTNGDLVVFKIGDEPIQAVLVHSNGVSHVSMGQVRLYYPDAVNVIENQ